MREQGLHCDEVGNHYSTGVYINLAGGWEMAGDKYVSESHLW